MPPQQLVFEGPTPESVILEALSAYGPDVQLTSPEHFRRGGVMGFFAQSGYRVRVMPPKAAARAAAERSVSERDERSQAGMESYLASTPDVAVDLHANAPTSFDDALARAAGALGRDTSGNVADAFDSLAASITNAAPLRPAPARPAAPIAPSAPATLDPLAPYREAALNGEAVLPSTDGRYANTDAEPGRPADLFRAYAQSDSALVSSALRTVGFPVQLLAQAAARLPVGFDMEQVLATLPAARALPRVPGTLIAVLGPETRALLHARRIAAELGLAPEEVALARTTGTTAPLAETDEVADGWAEPTTGMFGGPSLDLYVETAEQATALSPGWRRDRIGVVALALAPTLDGAARGRAMLRALRPSMTLLCADGTHKAADVTLRAEALGGVDGLILHSYEATLTPAEILAANIPVARIGDQSATPAAWVRVIEGSLDQRAEG